jgi:hypothetical protein
VRDVWATSSLGPDGAVVVRYEPLKRYAYHLEVAMEALEGKDGAAVAELVVHDLLAELHRSMARCGRLPVDEVVVQRHEDLARQWMHYQAEVMTRESDQGEWPSVWKAIHEDGWWH